MESKDLATIRSTAVHPRTGKFSPRKALTAPWFCLSLLAATVSLRAASTFYVDSDWTGAQSGSAAQPWKYLSSSAWSAINSALASADVTVCFSAREAGSDTDDIYDSNGDG